VLAALRVMIGGGDLADSEHLLASKAARADILNMT
jgi:hypothetical protein